MIEAMIEGIVKSIKNNGSKIEFEINNVLAIYYKTSEAEGLLLNVELGDKVSITGTLKIPTENTNFNLFNYRKYLLSRDIVYLVTIEDINGKYRRPHSCGQNLALNIEKIQFS